MPQAKVAFGCALSAPGMKPMTFIACRPVPFCLKRADCLWPQSSIDSLSASKQVENELGCVRLEASSRFDELPDILCPVSSDAKAITFRTSVEPLADRHGTSKSDLVRHGLGLKQNEVQFFSSIPCCLTTLFMSRGSDELP